MTKNFQPPTDPALSKTAFRDAMARISGAVHLVTTDGAAGRAGLTATAFAPVTNAPPYLLVCLNRESRTAALIRENGVFAVNTLAAGQQELADVFAGRTNLHGAARFDHGLWRAGALGVPVLADALVSFVLRTHSIQSLGTHEVVIGALVDIAAGAAHAGLVYTRRAYHAL